jgi:hypothetical protein
MKSPISDWRILLIPFALLAVAIPFIVRANLQSVHAITDTTYPESSLVQIGLWAAQSGHLYPSLANAPFTPAPHGPAYYILLRGLAAAAPSDFDSLAHTARLISFLAFALTCIELAIISRRFGVSQLICIVPVLIIFTNPEFYPWTATARPDMIAMLFNVSAIMCFTWYVEPDLALLFAAGLFAGASIAFKQSMAAAALAIACTLLLHRRWRQLIVFCAAAAAVPLAVVAPLLSRREPVLEEMMIMRYFAKDLPSEIRIVGSLIIHKVWYFPLILFAVGGFLIAWKCKSIRSHLLIAYAVFAFAIGLFTLLNVGGNINYLAEGWIAFALLSSLGLDELRLRWPHTVPTLRYLIVGFLLVTLSWQAARAHSPDIKLDDLDPQIMKLIRGRRVFSDVPYLSTHGVDPELLDAYTTTQLELHNKWSSIPLQDQLHRRWFDFVILYYADGILPRHHRGFSSLSDDVMTAISQQYIPACILKGDVLLLYVPAESSATAANDPQIRAVCSNSPTK